MSITLEQATQALRSVVDPNTGRDVVTSKSARDIRVDGDDVHVQLDLGYPARTQIEPMRMRVVDALRARGAARVHADVRQHIVAHAVQRGMKLLPNVKNIIAVASGKGGVGKSTTAANLALALAHEGARVGVLDADIYGPSQPTMFGIAGQPETRDGKTMEPLERYGVQVNSIGFLVESDQPMVWRGPIVVQALMQLLEQTRWRDLDYLIVDMPPGTGDVQLTLSQKVPVTGAVIVTTPQDLALIDARRGLRMFEKVGIPTLGIVENMAVHVCSNCGHAEHIFGAGGGERMARDTGVEYLGALPLSMRIREESDAGRPTAVADAESPEAQLYAAIARKVAARVADTARDLSAKLPPIVVSPT